MSIEAVPSWIITVALIALYLVAVVNIGLLVEDLVRKARTGDLEPIPVRVSDRDRTR